MTRFFIIFGLAAMFTSSFASHSVMELSPTGSNVETHATGINDDGMVSGYQVDGSSNNLPYVWSSNGTCYALPITAGTISLAGYQVRATAIAPATGTTTRTAYVGGIAWKDQAPPLKPIYVVVCWTFALNGSAGSTAFRSTLQIDQYDSGLAGYSCTLNSINVNAAAVGTAWKANFPITQTAMLYSFLTPHIDSWSIPNAGNIGPLGGGINDYSVKVGTGHNDDNDPLAYSESGLSGTSGTSANAINDNGDIVGQDGSQAAIWRHSGTYTKTDIGSPYTNGGMNGLALNMSDTIVGWTTLGTGSATHGFLCFSSGSAQDLNTSVMGWTTDDLLHWSTNQEIFTANGVNATTQICGDLYHYTVSGTQYVPHIRGYVLSY